MFSIENLAWKDVDFNAKFTKGGTVLSSEQKGPNGGRIMWFPPYNLKFQENVTTNWNANNFIGRGEQIYTYTNTERGGTLNFTMLIDHPSIVNRWSRRIKGDVTEEQEQELLRFFAGCNDGNGCPTLNIGTDNTDTATTEQVENEKLEKNDIIVDPKPEIEPIYYRFYVFFPNDFSGIDYVGNNINVPINYLYRGVGNKGGYGYEMSKSLAGCIDEEVIVCKDKNGKMNHWKYQVDKRVNNEVLGAGNYEDKISNYKLNGSTDTYSKALTATTGDYKTIRDILQIDSMPVDKLYTAKQFFEFGFNNNIIDKDFDTLITKTPTEYELKIECLGFASSHGTKLSNNSLSLNRATVMKKWLESLLLTDPDNITTNTYGMEIPVNNQDVNSLVAKLGRHVQVVMKFIPKNLKPNVDISKNGNRIVVEDRTAEIERNNPENIRMKTITNTIDYGDDFYDDEYKYFKEIATSNSFIRKNIVEKVQYFDPAYHSITPEGFNGRLTFLHQCTRQGPTNSVADLNSGSRNAGNLAFGRPPVCVLRIGDFYNTKIIIESISIDYDNNGGTQWDLNPEGVGVQPMMANIAITFKFIGGSDITGPIARLQNAVSFNYYANASAYDRRSDYRESYVTPQNDTFNYWSPTMKKTSNGQYNHGTFSTINKVGQKKEQ